MGHKFTNFFNNISNVNVTYIGKYLFIVGIFFLPSALPISIIFLLLSLLISIKINYKKFFFDKVNILLITLSGLMIFSNFRYLFKSPEYFISENLNNTWVDLFNWIPLFLCFWGFQSYLRSEEDRKLFINALLISTVPVITSCILQFWLGIYGPFSTLGGLVTWFQREPNLSSVTGLFSNPNYAGFWLASIWPFAAYSIKNKKNNPVLLINFLLISYFLLMTNSRNAFIGLLISLPILYGLKIFIFSIIIIIFFITIIYGISNFLEFDQEIYGNFVPLKLINKFKFTEVIEFNKLIRIDGFKKAISFIKMRPIFGWGASLFPILYISAGGILDTQHTHNINLEIAFNYGVPASILLTSIVSIILIKSFKKIFFDERYKSLANKAWLSSMLVVIIYNTTDIPYYDGKFSLLSWIFLAGLKCIIDDYTPSHKI